MICGQPETFFALDVFCWFNDRLGVEPKLLSLVKIDAMPRVIRDTLVGIEFKRHEAILQIPSENHAVSAYLWDFRTRTWATPED
jgi:hypothetical protein